MEFRLRPLSFILVFFFLFCFFFLQNNNYQAVKKMNCLMIVVLQKNSMKPRGCRLYSMNYIYTNYSINKGNLKSWINFFFLINVNSALFWDLFIAKIIFILQKYFFWRLRCANHVKFIEECMMCMEKHDVFSHNNVYKWSKPGFAMTSLNWKDTP